MEEIEKTGIIFEGKTHGGVGQDKKPPGRFSGESLQPVSATGERKTATDQSFTTPLAAVTLPKHHGSERRQTALIAGRVPPHLKTQILRRAKLKGWSESKTVKDLVEQALARNLAEQFAVTLKNSLAEAFTAQLQEATSHIKTLSYQGLYSNEQVRILVIQILHLIVDGRTDVLADLLAQSQDEAVHNMKPYMRYADKGEGEPAWQSLSSTT